MPVQSIAVEVITASRDTPVLSLARTMRDEELGDVVAEDVPTPDPVTIHQDATDGEMPEDVATVIEWQSREYRPEA